METGTVETSDSQRLYRSPPCASSTSSAKSLAFPVPAAERLLSNEFLTPQWPSGRFKEPSQLIASETPGNDPIVSISAETYARLMSLADQAPLECLPLTSRTLARAKTLGYNRIGQVRDTPTSRLLEDLGEDRAEEVRRALFDFGMRQTGTAD